MEVSSKERLFLFFGSTITIVFGLAAAFVPGLAYVTVSSYFQDVPIPPLNAIAQYQSLEFGVHMFTAKLVISAIGGLVGLFSLLERNNKPAYMGFAAIVVASVGLMLPVYYSRLSAPAVQFFDVPWIGVLLVLVGVSTMFLGLAMNKTHIPRITVLSVPLLLAVYLIRPICVLCNFLPWIVFSANSSLSCLIGILTIVGHALMLLGSIYAMKASSSDNTKE